MSTSYETQKVYKVKISGEITIVAANAPVAQAAAVQYWVTTGQHLDFNVEEISTIKPVVTP